MAFLAPVLEHPAVFISGERYHGHTPVDFKITNGNELFDFNFGAYHVPILKEDTCNKIISIGGYHKLQKIPIRINGQKSCDLSILNVISVIPCFDFERSRYTTWDEIDGAPEKIGSLRMVIDLKVLPSHLAVNDIARVAEWPNSIVVTGNVSSVLAEVSGVKLEIAD